MSPHFLVTHSGGFHADELLSSVILSRLFPDAKIVRSRDRDWITPSSDKIIYDVGGIYDAQAQVFDHHQRGAPLRDDERPYSSFGLVWKHFGQDYLTNFGVPEADINTIFTGFDEKFVLPIDLADNGAINVSEVGPLSSMTLPGLLETLKPVFDEVDPQAEDRAFHKALAIARSFIEAEITRRAAKLRAHSIVVKAIETAGESPILELPMGMPFRSAVREMGADHLLFVISPRGDDWMIGGIRKFDQGFEQRADLPAAWAGLTDADLEKASGVKGASFCHNARFIAAAKTREAIVAMADIAVREAKA